MSLSGDTSMVTVGDDRKERSSNSSSRLRISSRSRPINDEERSSLTAPPRKAQEQLRQADKQLQDFSSEMSVAPDGKYEDAHFGTLSVVPEEVAEYGDASTYVPSEYATKLTTIAGSVRDKNHLLVGEGESGQARPGVFQMRGVNYRSGESTQLQEEYNNRRMPLAIAHEIVLSESPVEHGLVSAYAVEDPSLVHEAKIINVKRQRVLRILMIAVIVILVIGVVIPVVLKTGNDDSGTHAIEFSTIIVNLCSPRHLKIHNNKLFVPEAGVGPMQISGDRETPPLCLPSSLTAISGDICFGKTGQVNVYNLDGTSVGQPALKGLFSARPAEGAFTNQVYGASGVDFDENGNMFTLLGLGYINASEVAIQDPELVFASILRGGQPVASPWVKIFEENYAGVPIPESNPFHMFIHDSIIYVVDAGADLLYTYLNVEAAGTAEPDLVIVLPKIENVPAVKPNPRGGPCNKVEPPAGPSFCGQYQDKERNWLYSANPVPTAVRVNPKEPNQLYVAYLSGTIWNEPVSGIFYMDLVNGIPQNDTLKAITGGLWAVIDFGFYEDGMLVLETNPGGFVPFDGRLSRVVVDSNGSIMKREIITEDLYQPVSMIILEDNIYLSNNTFNMGIDDCNGQILRAQLR